MSALARDAPKGGELRITSILAHDEARGREALAERLAYHTSLAPSQAIATLRAAPRDEYEAGAAYASGLLGISKPKGRRQ
jgi:hypothetical protein